MIKEPVITPIDMGRGHKRNETTKKYEVDLTDYVDNKSVKINKDGKLEGNGFDCESISKLPEQSYDQSTYLLGQKDGKCVRVTSPVFADLMIKARTNKTIVQYNETTEGVARISFRVTNNTPATVKGVDLSLVMPLLGSYRVGEVSHNAGDNVVKVSDTHYTIKQMNAGASIEFGFTATFESEGSFTFAGQVSGLLDTNLTNNNDNVTVQVSKIVQSNETETAECPLFTITDTQLNKPLRTLTLGSSKEVNLQQFLNIYTDKKSLANRTFKIEGAKQILVTSTSLLVRRGIAGKYAVCQSSPKTWLLGSSFTGELDSLYQDISFTMSGTNGGVSLLFNETDNIVLPQGVSYYIADGLNWGSPNVYPAIDNAYYVGIIPTSEYSFDSSTGVLSFGSNFTNDYNGVVNATNALVVNIFARPQGENCKWQVCTLLLSGELPAEWKSQTSVISNTDLEGVEFVYANKSEGLELVKPTGHEVMNWVNGNTPDLSAAKMSIEKAIKEEKIFTKNTSVTVRVPSGKTGSFTLTASKDQLASLQLAGAISTSYDANTRTTTVNLNNPQPSDSIMSQYVNFEVI